MLLTFDVGNTNIKTGLFCDNRLSASFRISTDPVKTSDEYGIQIRELIGAAGFDYNSVDGVIISSVVPGINYTLEHMIADYFHIKPLTVGPGIKTGLNILYDNPREVGADRIVNAVAAFEQYGGPVIVIDFGTATTFGAVSETGDFLGGAICPGIKVSLDAIVKNTAKLPPIELVRPKNVINRNTVLNMQAGVVYGCAGQVSYIIKKMREEMGSDDARIIATGGLANLVGPLIPVDMTVDPLLTLKGLQILFEKNAAAKRQEA